MIGAIANRTFLGNHTKMIEKPKNKGDWSDIRRICCETGKAGAPIEESRWSFFGENWIGPYQKVIPEWTWIAKDEKNSVIGYLTGCPDTAAFEKKRLIRFDFPLILLIFHKRYAMNADVKRYLKRRFGLEKGPEHHFPANVHSMLKTLYPAHLHINLNEKTRGGGIGRKLVETYFDALREKRICGVHVFCGDGPVRFYERLGFQILHTIEFRPGVNVHCMGIAL
jgi:GNAT superfamily N-acetyltransferase